MQSKRPWNGVAPRDLADALRKQFAFREDFPLEDRLSEALYWLKQRTTRFPTPEAGRRSYYSKLEDSLNRGETTTMAAAITVGLWRMRNSREAVGRNENGIVRMALRGVVKRKPPGRATDWARQSFFRSLGAIYEDGTGLKPSTAKSRGKYRGKVVRFAETICRWIQSQEGYPAVRVGEMAIEAIAYRRLKTAPGLKGRRKALKTNR